VGRSLLGSDGHPSGYSAPPVESGLLRRRIGKRAGSRRAAAVAAEPGQRLVLPQPYLRKEFPDDEAGSRAMLYVTALGLYRCPSIAPVVTTASGPAGRLSEAGSV